MTCVGFGFSCDKLKIGYFHSEFGVLTKYYQNGVYIFAF